MKAINKLSMLLALVCLVTFSSCNPTNDPNDPEKKENLNYLEQNALVKAQLRGKVKTVTEIDGSETYNSTRVHHYNEQGNLSKIEWEGIHSWNGQSTTTSSLEEYTYNSDGILTQIRDTHSNEGEITSTKTTTFEYNNAGKYVPNDQFHIPHSGFTPGLSKWVASSGDGHRMMEYKFVNDKLYMICSQTNSDFIDTLIINYSGAYPTNYTRYEETTKMTFQANGMLNTVEHYTKNNNGSDKLISKTTYLTHDIYQLEQRNDSYYGDAASGYTYQYNEHGDEQSNEYFGENASTTSYTYVYDSENNWTSKTVTSSNMSEPRVIRRTITYYE